jgi:hypothetical protein
MGYYKAEDTVYGAGSLQKADKYKLKNRRDNRWFLQ